MKVIVPLLILAFVIVAFESFLKFMLFDDAAFIYAVKPAPFVVTVAPTATVPTAIGKGKPPIAMFAPDAVDGNTIWALAVTIFPTLE